MADVAKLEKKIAELEKKVLKLMGMEDDFSSQTTENLQEMLVKLDLAAKVEEKILTLKGEVVDTQKLELETEEAMLKTSMGILEALEMKLTLGKALSPVEQQNLEYAREAVKVLGESVKIKEKSIELGDQEVAQAEELGKSLGASLGLAASYQESFMGKMGSTLDGLANNAKAQAKFKDQLKETFHPMNLLSSLAAKIFQSTMMAAVSYDQAASSFNAATGAAGEYNAAIEDASRGASSLGVGVTEAGAAMGALHANMSGFTNLSKESAATLAQGTAALEKLGISGATTAKNLDMLTKHMGLSAEAAMEQQKQMAEFAGGIGVAPAKMAEDFAAAAPKLVAYGAAGHKVFKNLAKTAKSTGIEMQALLGIAEQFDTFEGAAQAAGKLNAMLGGPLLNSVELLTATEDERIQMMRDAVTQSGKSWESLNKFEKKALAAAAGISDLDQAGRLFGKNSEENAAKQKNLNDMIEKSQAVTDKLKNIMMNFAIMIGPMVDMISSAASAISKWMDENKTAVQIIGSVIMVIAAIVLGIKAFVAIGALFISTATMMRHPIQAMKKPIEDTSKAAGKGLAVAIRKVGIAAKASGKGLLALGAAALMIGIAIAIAAYGVSQLVMAFAGLNPAQILGAVAALIIFGITIVALASTLAGLVMSGVLPLAATGLFALGAAALMFGGAALIAGLGIKIMVGAIGELMQLFIDNITILPVVALGMLSIAGAMFTMGLAGMMFPLIAAGFGAMALGVGALAIALALIKTDDLVALGNLGLALGNMTAERSIAFKASMEGFESAVDAADGAGIMVMLGMTKFLEMAGFVTPTKAAGREVGSTIGKEPAATAAPAGPTTVKLILNDREFAKAVINVMDKKMNLRTA